MPNWTSNRIYIEGDQPDIRAFLQAVKWEDELFDFNRIIPMPDILKRTGSGHREIDGKRVESWYIVKPWHSDFPGQKEQVRLFTPEEEAELETIGCRDWYGWALANWGTKWNAGRVEIDDTSINYGSIEIIFETAWSAPILVLVRMREMFPALTFDCRWRYEDESPYPNSLDDFAGGSATALRAKAGAA
jgi:hypothetical protein